MKHKAIAALFVTTVACLSFVTSSCSKEVKQDNKPVDVVESVETMPLGLRIDDGAINNQTGLHTTYKLNEGNGKYIKMYVENKGTNDVVATINGNSSRIFKPGDKGSIYAEVTQSLFGGDKEYVFKVTPGKNGGIVNITYEIAQQETQA